MKKLILLSLTLSMALGANTYGAASTTTPWYKSLFTPTLYKSALVATFGIALGIWGYKKYKEFQNRKLSLPQPEIDANKYSFHVASISGRRWNLNFRDKPTLAHVKAELHRQMGRLPADQDLHWALYLPSIRSEQLDTEETFQKALAEIREKRGSISLQRSLNANACLVQVKTLRPYPYWLDFDHTPNLTQVKNELYQQTGILPQNQQIVWADKILDTDKVFQDVTSSTEFGGLMYLSDRTPKAKN